MNKLLSDYRATLEEVKAQNLLRSKIMQSDEYIQLETAKSNIGDQQLALLADVHDSREEHEMDKKELFAHMVENNITALEGYEVKTRVKSKVDVLAVLNVFQGDLDSLMLVTSITQKALKDFWKDNKEYAKVLRPCVKEVGFSISDVIPIQ